MDWESELREQLNEVGNLCRKRERSERLFQSSFKSERRKLINIVMQYSEKVWKHLGEDRFKELKDILLDLNESNWEDSIYRIGDMFSIVRGSENIHNNSEYNNWKTEIDSLKKALKETYLGKGE